MSRRFAIPKTNRNLPGLFSVPVAFVPRIPINLFPVFNVLVGDKHYVIHEIPMRNILFASVVIV
jgi:hypothetical protein